MLRKKSAVSDGIFTVLILLGIFGLNLLLQTQFQTHTMTPMLFVLGVFWCPGKPRGIFGALPPA